MQVFTSGGHALLVPSHDSDGSQLAVDARHTVPAPSTPSGGQLAAVPLHDSARSHAPDAGRHTTPLTYAGTHAELTPEQR